MSEKRYRIERELGAVFLMAGASCLQLAIDAWCNYHYIMVRTQIQLTPEQHRQLKKWAHQRGISLSEAIRRFITDRLDAEQAAPTREALVREAMTAVGAYRDPTGASDVAREHDRYLTDAYRT